MSKGAIGLLVMISLLVLGGWAVQQSQANENQATATAVVTLTPLPTATAYATSTPTNQPAILPANTPSPPPTQTVLPTVTPSPTPPPTQTPTPTLPPVDRLCPDPLPLKPNYSAYTLSANIWPTPNPDLTAEHFWLDKMLSGGGRLLITQWFPYGFDVNGRYLLHNGVDTAEKLGSPILAPADGVVVVAQDDENELYGWRCNWYGHLVVIQLDEKWADQPVYVLFGHVLNISVEAGQRVYKGEQVAEIGFGGAATHPHLHTEVRLGSNEFDHTRNPMLWIHPGGTRGVITGRLLDPQGYGWQGVSLSLAGHAEPLSTWSYLEDPTGRGIVNPDEGWAENFVFADVRPGEYEVYVNLQGVEYRVPVVVEAGKVSSIDIITEPYKTPTPTATPTATPES